MTNLFINSNGEYPRYIGDLLLDYPEWDGKLETIPNGWKPVFSSDIPELNEEQTVEEGFPEFINGTYYQKFSVKPLNNDNLDNKNKIKMAYLLANGENIPLTKKEEYGL